MNLRQLAARVFAPFASYGSLEERAFADALRTRNASGVWVTEASALNQAAVWACVRVISESLAMLPMDVIQRTGSRRETLGDHPVAWLMNTTPNAEMPAFRFREALAAHALLWGNAYAEIERDTVGRPYALHLLTPDRVAPMRNEAGALVYDVRQGAGSGKLTIAARDMLHVAGLGWDGIQGYGVVSLARQGLGLGAAMETLASAFYGNNMQLGTVYTTDQKMTQDQVEALRDQLEKLHRGSANAYRAAILSGGLKPGDPPMPMTDAQFLDSRRFNVLEVCRWFRVPPHLVAELERATHANIEQEQLAFVTHCLMPWAVRFESEVDLKLFGRNQQGRQSIKHNFGALLRADSKTRNEAFNVARQGGWLSANEIRALEDLNGIGADGDVYLVPANMTTLEKLQEPTPAPVNVTPAASEPAPDPAGDPVASLHAARQFMHLVRSQHAA